MKKIFVCVFLWLGVPIVNSSAQSIPELANPDSAFQYAGSLIDNGRFQDAVEVLTTLERQQIWMEDRHNARRTFNNLGYCHFLLQKHPESAFYYEKAVTLAQQLQDTSKWITSQASLAMAYRQMAHYARAMDANQAALRLSELSNSHENSVSILNTMGLLYQNLEQWDKALENHRTALPISIYLSDTLMSAYIYTNLAISHAELGHRDSSLYYNLRSLELKRMLNLPPHDLTSNLNNIGEDYLALDKLELAEAYLMQASKLYSEKGENSGLIISHNNLGNLALKKSDYEKAWRHLERARELLDKTHIKDLYLDYLELKTSLLEKLGNYKGALTAHKELAVLREEVFQAERLAVQQVESSYLLREKELERATAAQEAELAKAESKRNIQWMVFLLIVLSAAAGVAFFFIRLSRQLSESNRIIQTQKLDLKHSTYNTLMRIQALLRLTTDGMPDTYSKEKLQQVEAAIISAASLQQFTYNIENENEVSLGKFLQELIERLKEAFSNSGHAGISYSVEIKDDGVLPVKTVLNCGLMVGEIVNNAVKYAFPDVPEPKIEISLTRSGQHLLLRVGDNGVGLDIGKKNNGVGTGLVFKLAKYIRAGLTVRVEGGTWYTIQLKI